MLFDSHNMGKSKATLNIDSELHRNLKIEAAKLGIKISELAEKLIKEGLDRIRKRE